MIQKRKTEKKEIIDRRFLPDRRHYDYLNSSSLAPEDRRRYDRRKIIRRRRRITLSPQV